MPRWTVESRAKQAELIRSWSPWKASTGPRTAEGKTVVGQNAHRLTIRKLWVLAGYVGKQQALILAGKQWDGRAALKRRLEWATCEPAGFDAD